MATRNPSLVRRLVLLAAAWSLAVLAFTGLALSLLFSQTQTARFDDQLTDILDGLLAATSTDGGVIQADRFSDPKALRAYSGRYWEVATPDAQGRLNPADRSRSLWDGTLSAPPSIILKLVSRPGKTVFYDAKDPSERPLRVAAVAERLPEVAEPVIFIAAEDRTPVDRDIRLIITTITLAFGLLGLGLLLAVIVQVRVGLRPLFALREAVARVRTGEADRLEDVYPRELTPLAQELNALMAHNQDVVERQRMHVGNLAHALKTPISVMLAEAERQGGPLGETVRRQTESMSRQVDHHLRRARAAARSQGLGERTAVGPVAEDLTRTLEKIFRDKVRRIDCPPMEGVWFQGERQDLLEILGNLMENACKWCQGRVRLSCDIAPGPSRRFVLTVEDDGEGLDEPERDLALKRGVRLDESAPGSGLGLAIVDDLVRAYGGEVRLGRSDLGGLKVSVDLPLAAV
jgi:signal transduction histidine kinase